MSCSTLEEVAEVFGKKQGTIRDWRTQGMPGEPGCYPIADIFGWLTRRITPRKSNDAEKRWRIARADKAELELERLRISVVPKTDLTTHLVDLAETFKKRLARLPKALAAELEGLDERARQVVLRERFSTLLDAISGDYAKAASDLASPPKTKPKTRRGRPPKPPP